MVLQAAIDIKSDRCSTKNITKSSFQHIFALPATWKPCMNTHTRKPNASLNSLRSGKCFLPLISPSLSLFLSLTLPIPRYPSLTRTCAFPPLSPRSLTRSPPPSLSLSVHPFPAPRISLSLARCSLCLIFSIFLTHSIFIFIFIFKSHVRLLFSLLQLLIWPALSIHIYCHHYRFAYNRFSSFLPFFLQGTKRAGADAGFPHAALHTSGKCTIPWTICSTQVVHTSFIS